MTLKEWLQMLYYKWVKGVCRKPCFRCKWRYECWSNMLAELKEQHNK